MHGAKVAIEPDRVYDDERGVKRSYRLQTELLVNPATKNGQNRDGSNASIQSAQRGGHEVTLVRQPITSPAVVGGLSALAHGEKRKDGGRGGWSGCYGGMR